MDDNIQELQEELAQYRHAVSAKENDILLLSSRLEEANQKLLCQETENASLKRLVERSNSENDQLLEKLSRSDDQKMTLSKELIFMKEALTESTMARDDVIDKLKNVSFETRELIDKCNKAYEESELCRLTTTKLEEEMEILKHLNDTLRTEKENLQLELGTRDVEIKSLHQKLESFNSQSSISQENHVWCNDISTVNNELRNIEQQIKTIIANLQSSETERRILEDEVKRLKFRNASLQEQNVVKDGLISKQTTEFHEVKTTVDEYHSEILRLDAELKDCHKRVATLNENLEAISSENPDVIQFMHFKRSLARFGNIENIESLLSKLLVLQEIEQFFEKNLSSHVEPTSNRETDSNDSTSADKKQDTINRIKSYLEKALSAIEKLNDKMIRQQNEYENKLHAKTSEISTLREVLSNAILYNKILEQTLQQYKDNVQLDKTIGNETDELLIVNETLLDGFDILKQLHRISEQSNGFLYAKFEQLKFLTKLVELNIRSLKETDEAGKASFMQRLDDLFVLLRNVFEEISANEPSAQKLVECQQVIEKCEKSLVTKDYLKNTVENMSQEVKRLTSKVEHEMSEKIREIEALKGEVDNVKTDNRELVCKIKNCNREIVSLSTENYDLNEKLESLNEIENQCEILKHELELIKGHASAEDNENIENMKNLKGMCSLLRTENTSLKRDVGKYVEENKSILTETRKMLCTYVSDMAKYNENVGVREEPRDFNDVQLNLGSSAVASKQEVDQVAPKSSCSREIIETSLISLKETCSVLKKDNENLKADIATFLKLTSDEMMPGLHASFTEVMKNIDSTKKCQNSISASIENVARASGEVNDSKKAVQRACEGMANEFSKEMQTVLHEIQKSVVSTFENTKSSFAISNDEMIKEMQEMNAELKKRGELISSLTQSLSDAGKDNKHILEQISVKENTIAELNEKLTSQLRQLDSLQSEFTDMKSRHSLEVNMKTDQIESFVSEINGLLEQIRLKEDLISTLKNDVQKQKEMHDGDVSSVGTLSRTEEASRLKDVEDTFEERYMKLKIIAVKMKKNIADLNQELKTERGERTSLEAKLVALAKQAKMSQALQEECDKLNDDLELKNNEIKELKKIIQTSDKGGETLKSRIDKLHQKIAASEHNNLALLKDKSELEVKIKTMYSELEAANREKLAEEIIKKEKNREIQQLKQKIKELEESKESVKNELEKAMKEIRKQGALSLEMRDFEKTISDLRADVKDKETIVKELRTKLASSADRNESLVETVKRLGEQVSLFVEKSKTMDAQILSQNKKISEYESSLKETKTRLKQVTQQLESEKSTNEALTLQLTNATAEIKCVTDSFRKKEASLITQQQELQSKFLTVQSALSKKEGEYNQLREDHEVYKARAHSLLQKMKNENNANSNEEKLRKEMDTLYQTIRELKKQLDSTTSEMNNHKAQLAVVEATKEKLQERIKELIASVTEKSEEAKAVRAEHKAYKLNADTLISCYKTEIDNLQVSLEEMKIELQKASTKTEKEMPSSGDAAPMVTERKISSNECCANGNVSNLSSGSHDSELENIDEARTFGKRRKHSVVPLETLLQSTKEESDEHVSPSCGNEMELRANIKSLEGQVNYLTRILNESEKNAARNEQQVAFLKEEIRRLQRVFEREPHLRNTEYLKNVLMKFVTLPVGEEKSQLITVLETMLKLTQNEKQTLSVIAKGQRLDQKAASGWTSYLGW